MVFTENKEGLWKDKEDYGSPQHPPGVALTIHWPSLAFSPSFSAWKGLSSLKALLSVWNTLLHNLHEILPLFLPLDSGSLKNFFREFLPISLRMLLLCRTYQNLQLSYFFLCCFFPFMMGESVLWKIQSLTQWLTHNRHWITIYCWISVEFGQLWQEDKA